MGDRDGEQSAATPSHLTRTAPEGHVRTATPPKAPTASGGNGVVSNQSDSGDWLEACSGMGEDCLNLNVCGGRIIQARHAQYGVARVGQYLWPGVQISKEHADRFSAAISSVAFFTAQWLLWRATVGVSCSCGSRNFKCSGRLYAPGSAFVSPVFFRTG
jgi:hypothetical protein